MVSFLRLRFCFLIQLTVGLQPSDNSVIFASVGDGVSLPCGIPSIKPCSSVNWDASGQFGSVTRQVRGGVVTSENPGLGVGKDCSLQINHLGTDDARRYVCYDGAFNSSVSLQVIQIMAEFGPEGKNLTLTCLLTCAGATCDRDFNLTWTGSRKDDWQSSSMRDNNTIIVQLFIPDILTVTDPLACSVYRERVEVAARYWTPGDRAPAAVWLALPLGLVLGVTGGLYVYFKRKHRWNAGNELVNVAKTPGYEGVQEVSGDEEATQQRRLERGTSTSDSFYDLLQAVY